MIPVQPRPQNRAHRFCTPLSCACEACLNWTGAEVKVLCKSRGSLACLVLALGMLPHPGAVGPLQPSSGWVGGATPSLWWFQWGAGAYCSLATN